MADEDGGPVDVGRLVRPISRLSWPGHYGWRKAREAQFAAVNAEIAGKRRASVAIRADEKELDAIFEGAGAACRARNRLQSSGGHQRRPPEVGVMAA